MRAQMILMLLVLTGFASASPTPLTDAATLGIVGDGKELLAESPGFAAVDDPGQYIVGLDVLDRARETATAFHGAEVLSVNMAIKFLVIYVEDPVAFNEQAAQDDNILYVEADTQDFVASYVPSEAYYGCCQWGIQDIGVETAWDTTLGSTSVILAVLDTGLRKTHEDIGNYLQGWDFIYNDNDPNDPNGHGTHVASTAAGLTDNGLGVAGVAQATILPVRVLNAQGSGSHSQIANGITYATDQGADIISMSLGAPSGSSTLLNAVNYAWNAGVTVIAATGNDNSVIGYPAKYGNAIAVGAYDQAQARASFSNYGPEMEISAPGVQIAAAHHTSDSAYVYMDGTSMATPVVSGAAALALAVDPTLTNTELRQLLQDTSRDFGSAGWDHDFGYGAVDAAALVAAAAAGGGGGGGSPVTVYSDDFEGATSFVKSSGSGDLWRLGSDCLGGNPVTSLQFNDGTCDYSTGAQATGWARVEVDLSAATAATWSFDHKWETESYSGGAYDIMRVQISADNSAWTTLQQWDSRDANQLTWGPASYDISAWAGDSTVYLRYFFDSLDGSYNAYDGWAIDNVLVTKE